MSKKLFSSLLLGFGSTLAVLVAISMPPGGWGVAVGVALGLLAAVPLFLVLIMLIRRQPQYPNYPSEPANYNGYHEPQMPPVVIIQQQLPQGQSMPLPPNAYGYAQAQYDDYAIEQGDYYGYDQNGQEYLPAEQMIDPRLLKQASRRQREVPVKRRRSQQLNQGYADNRYLDYPQSYEPQGYYEQADPNQALYDGYAGYYDEQGYYNEPMGQNITPPDLAYYEEQKLRRRRNAYRYSVKAATENNRNENNNNNSRYYTSNNQQYTSDSDAGQVVDGEFREINFYGED